MNLLDWMHRKFKPNHGDVYKDFAGGGTNCLSGRPSLDEEHRRRRRHFEPLPSARSLRLGHTDVPDRPSIDDDLFNGLLTIGTLGLASNPIKEGDFTVDDDFDSSKNFTGCDFGLPEKFIGDEFESPELVEAITEKAAEATTETDLMVVSAEIEKVLIAQTTEICSARTSHVSNGGGAATCPLQGYLFGSPVEMAETAAAVGERREKRASLGELFMRSRIAEEGDGEAGKVDGGSEGEGKSTAGMQMMIKKMLKRRGNKSAYGGSVDGSTTVEKKFQKILQMFHRKVHPESCISLKKNAKHCKKANRENCSQFGIDDDGGNSSYSPITSAGSRRKDTILSFNCCSNPSTAPFSGCDSSNNREHWIKTDAEYLVLEL